MSLRQKIKNIINLRNVTGRNSNGSRKNEKSENTLNTINVLPHSVTDNITIPVVLLQVTLLLSESKIRD